MRRARTLALLISLLMILSVAGCTGGTTASGSSIAQSSGKASSVKTSSDATSSEKEVSSQVELDPYAHRTLRVAETAGYWRITGRTAVVTGDENRDAMAYDHAAQGFFFNADCEGTVTLRLTLSGKMLFLVRVDGESRNVTVDNTDRDPQIVLAEGLARGKHSFEVYRCNELYLGTGSLNSIELNGTLLPYEAPKRDLKMIFLGDSITAGNGMLSQKGDAETHAFYQSDATRTYAFLCGEALNADFYVLAQSGMNTDLDATQTNSCYNYYDKVCWRRGELGAYDNTKDDVDIFVIGLGTNGWSKFSTSEMKEQIVAFITRVRADHPTAKIVWCYGQLDIGWGATIGATVRNMMKTDSNLFYYQFRKPNNASGYNHPTAEAQERDGQELTNFIRNNVLQ